MERAKYNLINPYYTKVEPFVKITTSELRYFPPFSPDIPTENYTYHQEREVPAWVILEIEENFGLTIENLRRLSTKELYEAIDELCLLREMAECGEIPNKTVKRTEFHF